MSREPDERDHENWQRAVQLVRERDAAAGAGNDQLRKEISLSGVTEVQFLRTTTPRAGGKGKGKEMWEGEIPTAEYLERRLIELRSEHPEDRLVQTTLHRLQEEVGYTGQYEAFFKIFKGKVRETPGNVLKKIVSPNWGS